MPGMEAGTILGHEGVGVIEEVGSSVRDFKVGDRVVVPSTICCGHCSYCTSGYQSQCDNANPNGKQAGTAFFGGPKTTGPLNGLQAEFARVPLADPSLVKLPPEMTDDQAILLSDIFPTGYFGADMAEIKSGDTVCVFGCGPVGLFAIVSAKLLGAGRVFAVDTLPDRLAKARELGAETIDFNAEHPVEKMKELTDGIGVLRAIDAVGVDAYRPEGGPAYAESRAMKSQFKEEQKETQLGGLGRDLGRPVGAGRRPVAGADLGRAGAGQGRDAVDHRRLPGDDDAVPDRHGDDEEPHHADGQLPAPQVHPPADRRGPGGEGRPAEGADRGRADDRRHLGLQGVRQAEVRLGEGRAQAGEVNAIRPMRRGGG